MYILGISAFYHDSAACLVRDGEIVAAAQEERFTRKKHDSSFPLQAIQYCLREGNITTSELDHIAFYENPALKLDRLISNFTAAWPHGFKQFAKALPFWINQKYEIEKLIKKILRVEGGGTVSFPTHHQSHAASAFFPSPFQEAAFLTLDGVGEWTTASYGIGRGNTISILKEIRYPHSLGLLYSAFTYYTGFKVNSAEYKVMGLAPYGEPRFADIIRSNLIDIKADGSFALNLEYFDYHRSEYMINEKFNKLFGGPPRQPESKLSQREMDLAASIQNITEEVMVKMASSIAQKTGMKYLCLAGGVALNCVANSKILESGIFEDIWIQPAAGDAGGALGAALFAWHQNLGNAKNADGIHDKQKGSYLGPSFDRKYIVDFLDGNEIPYTELDDNNLIQKVARFISEEKIVGWFDGRMEFGPRALGSRSILGDARSPKMQETMNLKIKFRESFRPFAPSVLVEHVSDYFDIDRPSPYMLLTAQVTKKRQRTMTPEQMRLWGIDKLNIVRSEIPAVTHIDYSARLQTVNSETNPRYHKLIEQFYSITGCPIIINTSFNVRGEPIVCTPEDAYHCFMATEIDYLVLGNFLLAKQSQKHMEWYRDRSFDLD